MVTCGGKGRMVFNNDEGRWLFAFVFFLYLQILVWNKDEDGLPRSVVSWRKWDFGFSFGVFFMAGGWDFE